jgi:hypothetical protein
MRVLDWAVRRLEKILEKMGRFYVIHSNYEGEPTPYLVRYVLFRTKFFSVYIHRFLLSDDKVPHDHPFWFWTYIVDGGYLEERWEMMDVYHVVPDKGDGFKATFTTKWLGQKLENVERKAGTIAFRGRKSIHRVVVYNDYPLEEKEKAPLSICFIGPMKRGTWGFYPDGEFVFAKDFLDTTHQDANNIPEKWRDG